VKEGQEKQARFFRFERFEAWKRAIEFADKMFEVADRLPQRYQFSLGEQLRRAAGQQSGRGKRSG